MENQNVVASRLGLPFKCGVCRKVHEKADLSNKDVCSCFAKAWRYALGYLPEWFSHNGDELIREPTWELEDPEYFNVPRSHHSYPIKNDVFMLSFPKWKIINKLRKKFKDWENDCLREEVREIERFGELKEVLVSGGRLSINGRGFINGDLLALLMMKRREVATALKMIWHHTFLDVEWKSLKKSAKVLLRVLKSGEKITFFVSESTGMVQVPNRICSIRKADDFLGGVQPTKNQSRRIPRIS